MEVQLYERLQDPLQAIDRFGEYIAKSGMFGCERLEQGKVLALACLTEKKSPIQILREYHLIDGRLCDRADSMLAKFKSRGGKYKVLIRGPEEAAIEMSLDQQILTFRLTWKEAEAEPFVLRNDGKGFKKNWATPRARMQSLWARVVSDGVRVMCPEIVAGIATPEEVQDDVYSEPKPLITVPNPKALIPEQSVESKENSSNPTPEPKPRLIATSLPGPTPRLTADTVAALEKAIQSLGPDIEQQAMSWLEQQGWIPPLGNLSELSTRRAQLILDKPEGLLKKLQEKS